MQETWVWSLGQEDLLEEDMATHCSILLWRIPWTEEPRELESVGSLRVGHGWATNISATAFKTRKLPDIQTKDCRSASVCILLELHPLRYSQTHIPENSYINWTQCINFSFAFSFFFWGGGSARSSALHTGLHSRCGAWASHLAASLVEHRLSVQRLQ